LQIVRGGKVSRLQNSTVICWNAFTVGPSWVTNFQTLIAPTRKEGSAKRWSWHNRSTTQSTLLFIFCLTLPRMWPHMYIGMTTSSTMSAVDEFETSSCIWGYHVYQGTWTSVIGEQLVCRRKDSNPCNRYIFVQCHFKTYYQKEIISLEKFCGYQLIHKNHETFPPRTICNIRYLYKFASIFICYTDLTIEQIMLSIRNFCLILWQLQTSQMRGMM